MKSSLALLMSHSGVSQHEGKTGEISCQFVALLSWKEDSHRKFVDKGQRREWGGNPSQDTTDKKTPFSSSTKNFILLTFELFAKGVVYKFKSLGMTCQCGSFTYYGL